MDLFGRLGDRVRKGLSEWTITTKFEGSPLVDIRDARRAVKESMASIVSKYWLAQGFGTEEDRPPKAPEVDMLEAHEADTTDSRQAD